MMSVRIQPAGLGSLGQAIQPGFPPGAYTVVGTPLRSMEECNSFDGQLYDGGRLCCQKGATKWFCRTMAPGAGPRLPGAEGGGITPPPTGPGPAIGLGTAAMVAAGIIAFAALLPKLLGRRQPAPT